MTEIKKDNNQVPVLAGVLNTDGVTPTLVKVTPTTHITQISDGSTGSDFGKDLAARDNSGHTVACASDTDGNIIPLYVDSSGNLLVKTT